MKAVIINSVCKEKSTGTLAYGLYRYLKNQGHEALISYGKGIKYPEEEELVKIDTNFEEKIHAGLTRLTGLQGYFSNHATNKLIDLIEDFKPNVIYLLNIHGYYLNEKKLLNYLADKKIKTIYIMPDEYPFLGKCCFSGDCLKFQVKCENCQNIRSYPKSIFFDQSTKIFNNKRKCYEKFEDITFVSVSYNIKKAKQSALLKNYQLISADWGIDLNKTYYPTYREGLFEKYRIPKDKKIILSVAPFEDERKGIKKYFYECAKRNHENNICFINIGFNGDKTNLIDNFIPIPYVTDQEELAALYTLADLFVICSMADTMPLAALISLGCGTPICCFNTSGLPYVVNNKCGYLVTPGDVEALSICIQTIPKKNDVISNDARKFALSRFLDIDFYKKLEVLGVDKRKKLEDINFRSE